jgi:hypothetical protein
VSFRSRDALYAAFHPFIYQVDSLWWHKRRELFRKKVTLLIIKKTRVVCRLLAYLGQTSHRCAWSNSRQTSYMRLPWNEIWTSRWTEQNKHRIFVNLSIHRPIISRRMVEDNRFESTCESYKRLCDQQVIEMRWLISASYRVPKRLIWRPSLIAQATFCRSIFDETAAYSALICPRKTPSRRNSEYIATK